MNLKNVCMLSLLLLHSSNCFVISDASKELYKYGKLYERERVDDILKNKCFERPHNRPHYEALLGDNTHRALVNGGNVLTNDGLIGQFEDNFQKNIRQPIHRVLRSNPNKEDELASAPELSNVGIRTQYSKDYGPVLNSAHIFSKGLEPLASVKNQQYQLTSKERYNYAAVVSNYDNDSSWNFGPDEFKFLRNFNEPQNYYSRHNYYSRNIVDPRIQKCNAPLFPNYNGYLSSQHKYCEPSPESDLNIGSNPYGNLPTTSTVLENLTGNCWTSNNNFETAFVVPCPNYGSQFPLKVPGELRNTPSTSSVTPSACVAAAATVYPSVNSALVSSLRFFGLDSLRLNGLHTGLNLLRPFTQVGTIPNKKSGYKPESMVTPKLESTTKINGAIYKKVDNLDSNESTMQNDHNFDRHETTTQSIHKEIESLSQSVPQQPEDTVSSILTDEKIATENDDIYNEEIPRKLENESRKAYKSLIIAAKSFMQEAVTTSTISTI